MLSSRRFSRQAVAALSFTTLSSLVTAQSIAIAYCSTLNTATNQNGNSSIYQSEGLCYNFCVSDYAFAVLSGDDCWCSNYVPGSGTTSTSSCNEACVGYPQDWCGNESKGLYGYIALTKSASGTKSSSAASATTSSSADDSSSYATKVTSTTAQTTTNPAATSSSSSTGTASLIVSVETVSGGGGYRTVTVTPTGGTSATAASSADTSAASSGGGGLSTGGAVGLTIGLVALVAIIAAIAFCCIRRRRKQAAEAAAAAYEEHNTPRGSSAGGIPTRTMSENSRYMLGTDGQRVVEGWQDDNTGSRASRLMPVDPRLDPFAPVYQRGDATKSRESVATIEDGHDYSRRMVGRGKGPLRAVNADDD